MPTYRPIAERFAEKFKVNEKSGCWEWTGSLDTNGYGQLKLSRERRQIRAHRLSYELHIGDPGRLHVLHRCDNPRCVNPSHLYTGTQSDNMQDMRVKRRSRHGERSTLAKLSEKQVKEIRRLASLGVSQTHLARVYGIGKMEVSRIVRGLRWAHSYKET